MDPLQSLALHHLPTLARPLAILPPHPTHLLVRWIHVLGMATLFGGAVLCWGLLRRVDVGDVGTDPVLQLTATYEWLFWVGAGLLVLTGVGNLGALAPSIPGPGTNWGASFATKLVGVVVLLVGSLVRTLGVAALGSRESPPGTGIVERLRRGYAATAVLLLAVVVLAEVMAHG